MSSDEKIKLILDFINLDRSEFMKGDKDQWNDGFTKGYSWALDLIRYLIECRN